MIGLLFNVETPWGVSTFLFIMYQGITTPDIFRVTFLAFLALVFNFILLTTNGGSQVLMMPVKVLAFAYLFSLLNASAISLFINNVEEDDFDDAEEYDEDEE